MEVRKSPEPIQAERPDMQRPGEAAAHRGKSSTSPDVEAPPIHRQRHGRIVGDVMLTQFELCNPDTEVDYVAKMMVDEDTTIIPVVDDTETMKPIGVVTARDIVHRIVARGEIPSERHARDCMSSKPVCVKANMMIPEAEKMLKDREVRRALVLDEKDRLCGIFLGGQQ